MAGQAEDRQQADAQADGWLRAMIDAADVRLQAQVPEGLRARFKANANLDGLTLQAALITAVTRWCDEREAVRAARRELTRETGVMPR
jgi:hypothetical protein